MGASRTHEVVAVKSSEDGKKCLCGFDWLTGFAVDQTYQACRLLPLSYPYLQDGGYVVPREGRNIQRYRLQDFWQRRRRRRIAVSERSKVDPVFLWLFLSHLCVR